MSTRILILAGCALLCVSAAGPVHAAAAKSGSGAQVIEDDVYRYKPETAPEEKERGARKSAPQSPAAPAPEGYGGAFYSGGEEPYGESFIFELRGMYWAPSLDTKIRVDSGELKGTQIDVVDDLGFARRAGVPAAEVTVKFFERHKIKLDYVQFSYSSRTTVEEEFVFNGQRYPAKSDVDADINIYSVRLGYEYDFFRSEGGYVSGRLSADYLHARASIVTNDILSNKATIGVVAPVLALSGRWNANRWLSLTGGISGVAYDKSSLFDMTGYVDVNLAESVGLTLGWRSIIVKIDVEEKKSDAVWSGFFGGIIFRI